MNLASMELTTPHNENPGDIPWEEDPRNARNWTRWQKFYTTLIVSVIGFVSTIATSIYAPGYEHVAREFNISKTLALLPLSTYAIGMGFGPSIASPMSETFGRKFVYLSTTPIFTLFILGSGFCSNITSLCICRFFAGFFGAPGVSIASATIADLNPPEKRGVPLAIYYSIPFVGALIGPLVGGFVVEAKGWRWTQWTTLFFAATVFPLLGFVHESYRKVIIRKIARRQGLSDPNHTPTPKLIQYFFTTALWRPIHMLFTEPIVGFVCLYCSFQFALLYTFIIGSPYIFMKTYDFTPSQQSLSFLGLIVGAILASVALMVIDRYVYQRKHRTFVPAPASTPDFPPEHRLYPAMLGSVLLPLGLFVFAWTARPDVHWLVPIVAQAITNIGSITAYVGANMYMLDTYGPLYGASAAGANSLARYILTASFPLFALQMFERLGTGWGTSLLGFATLGMAPIPWVFWRWGRGLRGRSAYEREL